MANYYQAKNSLADIFSKTEKQIKDFDQQCQQATNHLNKIFSFYSDDLMRIKNQYRLIIGELNLFLKGEDNETKQINFLQVKDQFISLKNILIQITQIALKLNIRFFNLQQSISSKEITQKFSQLKTRLKDQLLNRKQSSKYQNQLYIQQNIYSLMTTTKITQKNQQIQELLQNIEQQQLKLFEISKIKENLDQEKSILLYSQQIWQNQEQKIKNKQINLEQISAYKMNEDNPLCIILVDNSSNISFHNNQINNLYPEIIGQLEQKYENLLVKYKNEYKYNQYIQTKIQQIERYIKIQRNQENQFLVLISDNCKLNQSSLSIHFYIIGVSSYDQNEQIDQSLINQLKNQFQQSNQKIRINIIDVSMKPNYQTLYQLYFSLQYEGIISSIIAFNNIFKNYQEYNPKVVIDELNKQMSQQLFYTKKSNLDVLSAEIQNKEAKEINQKIKELREKEENLNNNIEQNNQIIQHTINTVKQQKEQLNEYQLDMNFLNNNLTQIQYQQQSNLIQYAETIEQLGQYNEIFNTLQENHLNLLINQKQQLDEKEEEKKNLIQNIYRLMKYLNIIILSLNLPNQLYTNLAILQIFLINSKNENICIEYTLECMLSELGIQEDDSFCRFLQNKANFQDILSQKFDNSPYKNKIQQIISLIKKYGMESIFSVQRIKQNSQLVQKIEKFLQLLETECSQ